MPTSSASSVLLSRVEALRLQCEAERRRREAVEHQIERLAHPVPAPPRLAAGATRSLPQGRAAGLSGTSTRPPRPGSLRSGGRGSVRTSSSCRTEEVVLGTALPTAAALAELARQGSCRLSSRPSTRCAAVGSAGHVAPLPQAPAAPVGHFTALALSVDPGLDGPLPKPLGNRPDGQRPPAEDRRAVPVAAAGPDVHIAEFLRTLPPPPAEAAQESTGLALSALLGGDRGVGASPTARAGARRPGGLAVVTRAALATTPRQIGASVAMPSPVTVSGAGGGDFVAGSVVRNIRAAEAAAMRRALKEADAAVQPLVAPPCPPPPPQPTWMMGKAEAKSAIQKRVADAAARQSDPYAALPPQVKPHLPRAARGRPGPGGQMRVRGKRGIGPCEAYVIQQRHEDRMAQLMDFDF